jgi:hypothetical protein
MRRWRIQLRTTKSHIDTLKFQMWVLFFKLCIIFTSMYFASSLYTNAPVWNCLNTQSSNVLCLFVWRVQVVAGYQRIEPHALTRQELAMAWASGEASPTIWSCYANFKSIFIYLHIDCFHGVWIWTRKYLHSMTKLSGWLRHWHGRKCVRCFIRKYIYFKI